MQNLYPLPFTRFLPSSPVFTPAPAPESQAASGPWARVESDGLERRWRGQTPAGDDAATCWASGDELVSHAIGGVTPPGSRAPGTGFYPDSGGFYPRPRLGSRDRVLGPRSEPLIVPTLLRTTRRWLQGRPKPERRGCGVLGNSRPEAEMRLDAKPHTLRAGPGDSAARLTMVQGEQGKRVKDNG